MNSSICSTSYWQIRRLLQEISNWTVAIFNTKFKAKTESTSHIREANFSQLKVFFKIILIRWKFQLSLERIFFRVTALTQWDSHIPVALLFALLVGGTELATDINSEFRCLSIPSPMMGVGQLVPGLLDRYCVGWTGVWFLMRLALRRMSFGKLGHLWFAAVDFFFQWKNTFLLFSSERGRKEILQVGSIFRKRINE